MREKMRRILGGSRTIGVVVFLRSKGDPAISVDPSLGRLDTGSG